MEWYSCATHAVLVETAEGTLLWDTSCPRDWETRWAPSGLPEYFPYDQVSGEQYFEPGHTPGTMAMRVDLPETGTMLFTSDAVYMGDSYGPPAARPPS